MDLQEGIGRELGQKQESHHAIGPVVISVDGQSIAGQVLGVSFETLGFVPDGTDTVYAIETTEARKAVGMVQSLFDVWVWTDGNGGVSDGCWIDDSHGASHQELKSIVAKLKEQGLRVAITKNGVHPELSSRELASTEEQEVLPEWVRRQLSEGERRLYAVEEGAFYVGPSGEIQPARGRSEFEAAWEMRCTTDELRVFQGIGVVVPKGYGPAVEKWGVSPDAEGLDRRERATDAALEAAIKYGWKPRMNGEGTTYDYRLVEKEAGLFELQTAKGERIRELGPDEVPERGSARQVLIDRGVVEPDATVNIIPVPVYQQEQKAAQLAAAGRTALPGWMSRQLDEAFPRVHDLHWEVIEGDILRGLDTNGREVAAPAALMGEAEFVERYKVQKPSLRVEHGAVGRLGATGYAKPWVVAHDAISAAERLADEYGFGIARSAEYGYCVDLDERGFFEASIRDADDNVIHSLRGDDVFADGFMADKDDVDGLAEMLQDQGVIEPDAVISPMAEFEAHTAFGEEPEGVGLAGMSGIGEAPRHGGPRLGR